MIIYVDTNYICHTTDTDGRRAFDVPFFDGHTDNFVEHYRYVPNGETWIRDDGTVFTGEMISPAQDYALIITTDELDAAYQTIGELVEMIYDNDMEVIG